MNKLYFYIVIIFCFNTSLLAINSVDSLALLNSKTIELQNRVDKLTKEIEIIKENEKFTGNLFDAQTNRFGLIITIAVAFFGFFTWTGYRREILSLRKQTKIEITNLNELITDKIKVISIIEKNTNLALADHYRVEANTDFNLRRYYQSIQCALMSLFYGARFNSALENQMSI